MTDFYCLGNTLVMFLLGCWSIVCFLRSIPTVYSSIFDPKLELLSRESNPQFDKYIDSDDLYPLSLIDRISRTSIPLQNSSNIFIDSSDLLLRQINVWSRLVVIKFQNIFFVMAAWISLSINMRSLFLKAFWFYLRIYYALQFIVYHISYNHSL